METVVSELAASHRAPSGTERDCAERLPMRPRLHEGSRHRVRDLASRTMPSLRQCPSAPAVGTLACESFKPRPEPAADLFPRQCRRRILLMLRQPSIDLRDLFVAERRHLLGRNTVPKIFRKLDALGGGELHELHQQCSV